MSKKHFKALAAALKVTRDSLAQLDSGHRDSALRHGALQAWRATVKDVAGVCAQTNERFDRDRFFTACGMDDEL